jgi:hypothetical protein
MVQFEAKTMTKFYVPELTVNIDNPFVRDGNDKLIRRSYWLDMDDRTLVMVMTKGIGANLTNDEKRAHLIDFKREHLIEQVCPQEILPLEKYKRKILPRIFARMDTAVFSKFASSVFLSKEKSLAVRLTKCP